MSSYQTAYIAKHVEDIGLEHRPDQLPMKYLCLVHIGYTFRTFPQSRCAILTDSAMPFDLNHL